MSIFPSYIRGRLNIKVVLFSRLYGRYVTVNGERNQLDQNLNYITQASEFVDYSEYSNTK